MKPNRKRKYASFRQTLSFIIVFNVISYSRGFNINFYLPTTFISIWMSNCWNLKNIYIVQTFSIDMLTQVLWTWCNKKFRLKLFDIEISKQLKILSLFRRKKKRLRQTDQQKTFINLYVFETLLESRRGKSWYGFRFSY